MVASVVLLSQLYVKEPVPPVGTPVKVAGMTPEQIVCGELIILVRAGTIVTTALPCGPQQPDHERDLK